MRVVAYIRTLVAKAQKKNLASYKIATVNAATYLQQLNLQQLTKTKKPNEGQDKREFYQALQKEALEGPIFSLVVIKAIERIVIDLNKDEVKWIANVLLKEHQDLYGLSTVVDWSRGTNSKLDKLSFAEAEHKAAEWHSQFHTTVEPAGKYKTKDVIFKLPGGYTIVKITDPDDLVLEGELMQHCVGGYCGNVSSGYSIILSLRDPTNKPHATIEMRRDGTVVQIQGKQNEIPVEKYQELLVPWLLTLKNTSWLGLIHSWDIRNNPKYEDDLEEVAKRDPSYIVEKARQEGHKDKHEDAIIASGSAKHILEYAISHANANKEKLSKAIAKTSNLGIIKKFASLVPDADIKLLENRLINASPEEDPTINLPILLVQFASDVVGSDTKALEAAVIATEDTDAIRRFATDVVGADIKNLERATIESKESAAAFKFLQQVEGADIDPLYAVILKDPEAEPSVLYNFAKTYSKYLPKGTVKALQDKMLSGAIAPAYVLKFAKDVPGADIEKLQTALIESKHPSPKTYYNFAKSVEGADPDKLAEALIEVLTRKNSIFNAENSPQNIVYATLFAKNIYRAPVDDLQEIVLSFGLPQDIVEFAKDVPGADKDRLHKAAEDIIRKRYPNHNGKPV